MSDKLKNERAKWMFEVEVKRRHLIDGKSVWKFIRKKVTEVKKDENYRCAHCKAEVKLYQGSKLEWRAEHKNTVDAGACPGSATVHATPEPLK